MTVFWNVAPCSLTDVSEKLTASIAVPNYMAPTFKKTTVCITVAVGT
jgi:hypothetical protein